MYAIITATGKRKSIFEIIVFHTYLFIYYRNRTQLQNI